MKLKIHNNLKCAKTNKRKSIGYPHISLHSVIKFCSIKLWNTLIANIYIYIYIYIYI